MTFPASRGADTAFDEMIAARLAAHWPRFEARLKTVYGDREDWVELAAGLRARVEAAAYARPEPLRALDAEREAAPDWLSEPGQGVYTFYVDRFAGTLAGLRDRLGYLEDLGVRWLHPLPLLAAREGDSDGGFAVADYRRVEPRLGTMEDLRDLADDLRGRGIGLILDVVCNHTAREHAWAERARAGDRVYRDYYITVSKAEARDRDAELVDVFPDTAPGSFTPDAEMGGEVWTTFYPFQWDLNYANPAVFTEMLDVLVFLAEQGVQGFRLDSAPYLWKAKGTTCRNLPQAYAIVEAWRAALSIVAPSVVLVAEAIESLADVLPFFGDEGPGCDLAYNNVVMTALWGALADQDAAVVRRCLVAASDKPSRAAWLNYVRCHDDVIWNALADYAPREDLRRWSDFYGRGEGFSHGRAFQTAPGGVPSTNGMAASLAGLAPGEGPKAPGATRLRLLYGILHALDGWPLIYMGDEIALGDDVHYRDDPLRAGDGRWLHRPRMDWDRAQARHDAGGLPGATFADFQLLGRAARELGAQGVRGPSVPVDLGVGAALAFSRSEGAPFLCVANLSDRLVEACLPDPFAGSCTDLLSGKSRSGAKIELPSYGLVWLKVVR